MPHFYKPLQRKGLIEIGRTHNHNSHWPLCMTCGRPVDSEQIVENRPGVPKSYVTILVKHHGAEERAEFDLGSESETDERDIARVMQRHVWFNPEVQL